VRRREALRGDWRVAALARTGQLRVDDVRGVWEGHVVRIGGEVASKRAEEARDQASQ
jgi:hypothetical protein